MTISLLINFRKVWTRSDKFEQVQTSLKKIRKVQTSVHKFREVWSSLKKFRQVWTSSDKFERAPISMKKCKQVWTSSDTYEQVHTSLNKFRQISSKFRYSKNATQFSWRYLIKKNQFFRAFLKYPNFWVLRSLFNSISVSSPQNWLELKDLCCLIALRTRLRWEISGENVWPEDWVF